MKKNKTLSLFFLCLLLLLFLSPELCFLGAKNGMKLWLFTVIPSLLPFIIVSNLLLNLNLLSALTDWIYPILHPLFKVSKHGCFPILIGMLSGYPMGAKSCADLVKEEKITLEEGQYLLSFVNNASPMFLTTYLAMQCLHSEPMKYLLYSIVLLSSFLCSIFYRIFSQKEKRNFSIHKTTQKTSANLSLACAMDKSILDGFFTITKIGGYILLFSILSTFLLHIPNTFNFISYGLLSITEITTAANQIGNSDFSTKIKIILTMTSTAFGGLSSLFQTQSVIAGSGLSLKTYFYYKLLQCLFVFIILSFILVFI